MANRTLRHAYSERMERIRFLMAGRELLNLEAAIRS
jgi:hypothetical protein